MAPSRASDRAACLKAKKRFPERSWSAARCHQLQTEIAGSRLRLTTRASKLADVCEAGSFASQSEIIASLVHRLTVAQDKVTIGIEQKALADRLLHLEARSTSVAVKPRPIMIEVRVRFRRRGVEARLVVLDKQQRAYEPDANLVKALARAHEWFGRTRPWRGERHRRYCTCRAT